MPKLYEQLEPGQYEKLLALASPKTIEFRPGHSYTNCTRPHACSIHRKRHQREQAILAAEAAEAARQAAEERRKATAAATQRVHVATGLHALVKEYGSYSAVVDYAFRR